MKYCDFDDELYKTYQKGRELAPAVLQLWMDEVANLVDSARVRSLIDLGAGTGRFSRLLGDTLGAEVIAVDPACLMLAQVDPAVRRIVARGEALPFPPEFCDAVFSSMVLHHFSDLRLAASEVRRILRPGGVFLVRTCFAETLHTPYHRFFPTVLELERDVLPTTAHVLEVFEAEGLQLLETRLVHQRIDDSLRSYAERIRHRAMSPLRVISDADFAKGMAELDEVARSETDPVAVYEDIDLLLFSVSGGVAVAI